MTSSKHFNPYHAAAGPELDLAVHTHLMGANGVVEAPLYSRNAEESAKVVARLKRKYGCKVVVGTVKARPGCYFARLETGPSTSVETWAETEALAICRLTAVVLADRLPPATGGLLANSARRLFRDS